MYSRSLLALSALCTLGTAQFNQATFTNMTFGPAVVGQHYPIYWTPGTGQPLYATLGNTTWNIPIFSMS